MEEYASNQTDFIFNQIENLLDKQKQDILWYMEKFFTEDEMKSHSENLLQMISKTKSEIPFIKMQLLKKESYAVIGEWTEPDGTEKWDVIHSGPISYEEALEIAHLASKTWIENVPQDQKHLPHSEIPIRYESLQNMLK